MRRICLALATTALVSCGPPEERAVFVTTTKIAIDGDATEQAVSVGYDRFEGFVGPAYDTGAIPPIVGHISTNTALFTPQVRQFYATGNAAIYGACPQVKVADSGDPCALKPTAEMVNTKRVMYFGTSSVLGLKAGFAANQPDSVTLGYKRKEFSWLPITKAPVAGENEYYGSVLASFGLDSDFTKIAATGVKIEQFFATGVAAEQLAQRPEVKQKILNHTSTATAQGLTDVSGQQPTSP